jgi:hypothetical protein
MTTQLGSKKSILFFVLALALQSSIAELIISSPDSIEGSYTAYPIIYRFNFRNETIDGEIVLANSSDVTDKIALVEYFRAEYLTQIRDQQNRGARAVIISAPPLFGPGQASYVLDGSSEEGVTLSAWHVSYADYAKMAEVLLKFPNETVSATLNPNGENPWKHTNDTWMIFVQISLTLFTVANLSLAIWRLVEHVKADGCHTRLPQACLGLIITGNIIRLIYVAVDPLWSRAIYPLPLEHLLWTLSHPFSLAVTILITFYWHDVMHGMSLNINQMLGRFKIPFIVVIVILFGIEIGFGITRALISVTGVPVAIMIVVNSIIYSIVCFGFAIFFFVTAAKLMRILNKKSHGEKSKRARTLRRMTTRVVVIGACLLSHVIIFVLLANTSLSVVPSSSAVIWFFSFLILCVQDLFQILALVPKPQKTSSMRNSSNRTTSQNNEPLSSPRSPVTTSSANEV